MRRTAPKGNPTLYMFPPESSWKAPRVEDLPSWSQEKNVSIDTEFYDPDLCVKGLGARRGVKIAGYSFAFESGQRYYVPLRHPEGNVENPDKGLDYLRDQASGFTGCLVGANIPTELDLLQCGDGITFPNIKGVKDVLVAAPLINELHRSYSLQNVAKREGFNGKDETLLKHAAQCYGGDITKTKGKNSWKGILAKLPAKYVGPYGEEDAWLPLQLLPILESQLAEQDQMECWNVEMQLLPILLTMRQRGVRIDFDHLDKVAVWAHQQEREFLDKIFQMTQIRLGEGNCMKTDACVPLFDAVGIKVPQTRDAKTDKLKYSLTAPWLESVDHPLAADFRYVREMYKLYGTFAYQLRNLSTNGRIHTTFNQIVSAKEGSEDDEKEKSGARFGRLSSRDPNMQQMPSRAKYAPFFRQCFLPEEGTMWGTLDFCFGPDVEVLTKDRGFVLFKDLKTGEHLAQWASEGITYASPTAYHRPHFDGYLLHIYGKSSFDLLVTPNHECLLFDKKGKPFKVQAEDYIQSWGTRQLVCAVKHDDGDTDPTYTDKEIITSVAVQADGSQRTSHYRILIKKERKVKRAHECVLHNNAYPCGPRTAFTVPFDSAPLLQRGMEKNFDREKILNLPLHQRLLFLQELLLWDGSISRNASGSTKKTYATVNEHNANVVQEVASVSGVAARVRYFYGSNSPKKCYVVGFSKEGKDRFTTETTKIEKVSYKGPTYCVSMPLGTLIVRRNGKVAITSQSQQEPRWTTHFSNALRCSGAAQAAKAYREDPYIDNHDYMAALTGLPRKIAKELFLALCYGEGGKKMCIHHLHLPTRWALRYRESNEVEYFEHHWQAKKARQEFVGEASYYETAGSEGQKILDQFNEKAPYIRELKYLVEKAVRDRGILRIKVGGRVIHFPVDQNGKYDWAYKGLNRLIQGTSGMQMKLALIKMFQEVPDAFIQLQVHDDVNGSFTSLDQMKRVAACMSDVVQSTVPFAVDTEYGPNYGSLRELCRERTCTEHKHDKVFCKKHAA